MVKYTSSIYYDKLAESINEYIVAGYTLVTVTVSDGLYVAWLKR